MLIKGKRWSKELVPPSLQVTLSDIDEMASIQTGSCAETIANQIDPRKPQTTGRTHRENHDNQNKKVSSKANSQEDGDSSTFNVAKPIGVSMTSNQSSIPSLNSKLIYTDIS